MTYERKSTDEYSEIRSAFALWLALPKSERKPRTQKAFARQHDLRNQTLSDWKALPEFSEGVSKNALSVASTMLGNVLHAIAGHAIKGDDGNARLFLETLGLVRSPGAASASVTVIGGGGLDGMEREAALVERDSILARRGGNGDDEGNGNGSRSS